MNREPGRPDEPCGYLWERDRSLGRFGFRYEVKLPGSRGEFSCSVKVLPYEGDFPDAIKAEQVADRREALGQILCSTVATTQVNSADGTWHAIAAIGWDPPQMRPYQCWGNTDKTYVQGPVDRPFESESANNTGYLWLQFEGSVMGHKPKRLNWNKLNKFLRGEFGPWGIPPAGPLADQHELAHYSRYNRDIPMLEVREGILGKQAMVFEDHGVLRHQMGDHDICLSPDQIERVIGREDLKRVADQQSLNLPRYFP